MSGLWIENFTIVISLLMLLGNKLSPGNGYYERGCLGWSVNFLVVNRFPLKNYIFQWKIDKD